MFHSILNDYYCNLIFTEWGKKEIFDQLDQILPPKEAMEQFAKYYVEAADQLVHGYSAQPENTIEKIVCEIKLFYLVQHMFFMSIMIKQTTSFFPSIPFDPKSKMVRNIKFIFNKYSVIYSF